jgi:hypothetical protein
MESQTLTSNCMKISQEMAEEWSFEKKYAKVRECHGIPLIGKPGERVNVAVSRFEGLSYNSTNFDHRNY